MPRGGFIIFQIFLLFFFRNSLARVEYERNFGVNFFFFTFSAYLIPFWLKIMPGRGFIIFLLFFRNFLSRVEYERNSRVKFCFHFFGLSPPVLAKNNARNKFYNFLNFFTIFFRNFIFRVE